MGTRSKRMQGVQGSSDKDAPLVPLDGYPVWETMGTRGARPLTGGNRLGSHGCTCIASQASSGTHVADADSNGIGQQTSSSGSPRVGAQLGAPGSSSEAMADGRRREGSSGTRRDPVPVAGPVTVLSPDDDDSWEQMLRKGKAPSKRWLTKVILLSTFSNRSSPLAGLCLYLRCLVKI